MWRSPGWNFHWKIMTDGFQSHNKIIYCCIFSLRSYVVTFVKISLVSHAKCKILAGPAFGQDFLEMGNTHFWEEKFHLRDRERAIGEGRYCTVSFNIKVSIDSKPYKGIKIYYFSFPKPSPVRDFWFTSKLDKVFELFEVYNSQKVVSLKWMPVTDPAPRSLISSKVQ